MPPIHVEGSVLRQRFVQQGGCVHGDSALFRGGDVADREEEENKRMQTAPSPHPERHRQC